MRDDLLACTQHCLAPVQDEQQLCMYQITLQTENRALMLSPAQHAQNHTSYGFSIPGFRNVFFELDKPYSVSKESVELDRSECGEAGLTHPRTAVDRNDPQVSD